MHKCQRKNTNDALGEVNSLLLHNGLFLLRSSMETMLTITNNQTVKVRCSKCILAIVKLLRDTKKRICAKSQKM